MKSNRRDVLKAISALGLTGLAGRLPVEDYASVEDNVLPEGGRTILFQGDSITDAGRSEAHYYPNQGQGMGQGYVRHIVTELMGQNPGQNLRFYNRGISGHKVFQLRDRWEDDCLQLEPDVLSIMIGVNDFWHTLNNYNGTAKVYEDDLDMLIDRTKKALPQVKLIMCEPFVCLEGTAIKAELWKGEFDKYQAACRKIAMKYNAVFVPFQQVFNKALTQAPASYWCPDGVHPSMAGNYIMAKAWLKAYAQV